MIRKCGLAAVAVALMVSTSAYAQKVEKEAVIVTVNGNTLNARTREGPRGRGAGHALRGR